ncbi:hypothetical protein OpiT1DRAFT_01310 [Opitutaceae bacterium TAV1]|nr:hypothetical protein OpiT1DRAFT_01310 [Opitutaceae bacterium TAV1]
MEIFVKYSTKEIISRQGGPAPAIAFKRREGDHEIRLTFLDDNLQPTKLTVPDGKTLFMAFGLKPRGQYGAASVVFTSDWAIPAGNEFAYVCRPNFNTIQLNALFTSEAVASVALMGEISWRFNEAEAQGLPVKTKTFDVFVANDVVRGDDVPPPEDVSPLQAMIARAEAAADNAEASEAAAAQSNTAAQAAKADANAAADAASESETAAEAAAADAEESASSAAASKTAAEAARDTAQAAATSAGLSATAAAASAADADADASASAVSAGAALAAKQAAEASEANAAASAASVGDAAATAQAQAAQAIASAVTAVNKAGEAAISAQQAALIAAGLVYKGIVVGNAIPNTLTNSGDFLVVTTPGTSQGKTWGILDLAIYKGVSGQWDQVVYDSVAHAYVDPLAAARAPLDYLWCDTATVASRVFWRAGAHGELGTSDFTVVIPGVQMAVLNTTGMLFCTRGTADVGYNEGSLRVYVYNDTIRVCLGSDTTSRTRSTPAGSANSLLERPSTIMFGRLAGDWFFYKDGVALALGAETVVGTPAIGWGDAFATAWMRLGAHVSTTATRMSRFGSPILLNRAWSQADVSTYISTGRVPSRDDVAGSMVPMLSEGFEAPGWGLWGSDQGTRLLATDIVRSGEQSAQYTPTQAGPYTFSGMSRNSTFTPGRAYRIGAWFYRPAGSAWAPNSRTCTTDTAAYTGPLSGTLVDDEWCYLEREIVAASTNLILYGGTTGVGDIIYVDDVSIIPLGTICAFDIGRTAQLRGKYNGIHAIATSGITPMPVRAPAAEVMEFDFSSSGYVGGDQSLVFDLHLIDSVEVLAPSAITATFRRGSSGGTVVATATVVANEYTALPLTASARPGAAGDKYYLTLSAATAGKIRIRTSRL